MWFKKIFDFVVALIGLILLTPFFLAIGILIKLDSKGPVFFKQLRVGQNNEDFKLFKFRSMYVDAHKQGLLTVGGRDPRITKVGYYIRKYKFDEFAQLINVLTGTMSLVGPRPEVRKYVDLYDDEQLKVLSVKPGITDWASIKYINENDVLAKADDPEKAYIEKVLPEKLKLSLEYVNNYSIVEDIRIIALTIKHIIV